MTKQVERITEEKEVIELLIKKRELQVNIIQLLKKYIFLCQLNFSYSIGNTLIYPCKTVVMFFRASSTQWKLSVFTWRITLWNPLMKNTIKRSSGFVKRMRGSGRRLFNFNKKHKMTLLPWTCPGSSKLRNPWKVGSNLILFKDVKILELGKSNNYI